MNHHIITISKTKIFCVLNVSEESPGCWIFILNFAEPENYASDFLFNCHRHCLNQIPIVVSPKVRNDVKSKFCVSGSGEPAIISITI